MPQKIVLCVLIASSLGLLGCSNPSHPQTRIIAPSYSYLRASDDLTLTSDGKLLATAIDQDNTPEP